MWIGWNVYSGVNVTVTSDRQSKMGKIPRPASRETVENWKNQLVDHGILYMLLQCYDLAGRAGREACSISKQ